MRSAKKYDLHLVLILMATAALWSGVALIGLNADDYQFIEVLAPVHSVLDVLRAFAIPDANPSYFRPIPAALTSLDFLVFRWWGGGYHLTNLLLHLLATALVFYLARDVFRMSRGESLVATLLFGLLASHETNLTVDMMRPDALTAIFVMLTLLLECSPALTDMKSKRNIALISFLLALLSKEIAVVIVLLLPIIWMQRETAQRALTRLMPYLGVTLLFFLFHQHFTSRPSELLTKPHVANLLRNSTFAVGYTLLPLDLSTAKSLLSGEHSWLLIVTSLTCLAALISITRSLDKAQRESLVLPILFIVITGAILCLDFQRWRVYLPSIGLVCVLAIVVSRSQGMTRNVLRIAVALLMGFHVFHALGAQAEFRKSTALLDNLRQSLERAIPSIGASHRLGILVSPAKFGSAGVWQLGHDAFVRRAEANIRDPINRIDGGTRGTFIRSWTALDVYSLDPREGFARLQLQTIATTDFLVSVPMQSRKFLLPGAHDRSWRDLSPASGDSIITDNFVTVVRSVSSDGPKRIEIRVLDTAATLLSFDGRSQFIRIDAHR